ncbi:hypothetical protein AADEFJLK_04494 [Methylovulum psychrotolerans]|uniref:Uncharacterized protein n=1 Tax=Methylovulum psychrotolerans TaxID=1704499 RepID=A0A2S5CG02_9GAMM|nr:hypothetical protein AADEFJLK_04494 [Methylovulum psychrotolerans]
MDDSRTFWLTQAIKNPPKSRILPTWSGKQPRRRTQDQKTATVKRKFTAYPAGKGVYNGEQRASSYPPRKAGTIMQPLRKKGMANHGHRHNTTAAVPFLQPVTGKPPKTPQQKMLPSAKDKGFRGYDGNRLCPT